MEFIPKSAPAIPDPTGPAAQASAALDARQRSIRLIGVAAVAAALGMAEGAPLHAQIDAPVPLPKAA